ncbi:MAG: iron-sulfur cluster biosynthesis family protein [Spirosomataceae bacterium]
MKQLQPISITSAAQQAIWQIKTEKRIPAEYVLRVGLKGAGCGATYLLGFDIATPTDEPYWINDIEVIIDKRHLMYVVGVELDYEAEGEGFVFHKAEAVTSTE